MKKQYIIPKGYKGISSEIVLQFNTNLAVITGLNGCGKSTMLKYLYEHYPDKSKCFIKTPQNIGNFNKERTRLGHFRGSVRYVDDLTFEQVIEDIESIGLRKARIEKTFLDKTDFYSALFDENSIYYRAGYTYLEAIAKLLSDYEFDELDNIKQSIGVLTQKEIENELVRDLNNFKDENTALYGAKHGRSILQKLKNEELNEFQVNKLKFKIKKVEEKLKNGVRQKAKISNEQLLKKYVYDLLNKEFRSIESIVDKMSSKIYHDLKNKSSKTKTRKLWENINDELMKYVQKGYFKYKLVPPQIFESHYQIAFERFDRTHNSHIHFDSLSSGEKIIFELICYYFASKESKLEMIMLDEFDANLNPMLAEQYIEVIKEQFKEINVVLTTHSPSTVVEVDPNELFELTDSRELKCAKNEDGKRDILKRLAPKFVYHGEFGILEDVFNQKYDIIIFTEGKNDVKNFHNEPDIDKYKFIPSNGAGNMNNLISVFKAIPFFNSLATEKKVVFLYDFDTEGLNKLSEHLPKSTNSQEIYDKIRNKESFTYKIDNKLKIFVSHLVPPDNHTWNIKDEYRHQELRDEGMVGVQRQLKNLEDISSKAAQHEK